MRETPPRLGRVVVLDRCFEPFAQRLGWRSWRRSQRSRLTAFARGALQLLQVGAVALRDAQPEPLVEADALVGLRASTLSPTRRPPRA